MLKTILNIKIENFDIKPFTIIVYEKMYKIFFIKIFMIMPPNYLNLLYSKVVTINQQYHFAKDHF